MMRQRQDIFPDQAKFLSILPEDFAERLAMVWTGDAITTFPPAYSFCIASHLLSEISLRPTS